MSDNLDAIKTALRSADEETRRAAIQGLNGYSSCVICPVLFSAMADESWRVRKEAVDAFVAADPDSDMVESLLDLLRNDDNAGLRNSSAEALAKLRERSIGPLVRHVNDPDADVRKFVIDVMGAIGSHDFYIHLLNAVKDQDVNVAAAAAEHLGNLGDSRAVPELLSSIAANSSDFFRFNALAAIGKLAAPAPVPHEITVLADNEILRKAVYACLGSIADASAFPFLVSGMASRQKSCRETAVIALHKIYTRSTSEGRRKIESDLRGLKDGSTIPLLLELFDLSRPALGEALVVILNMVQDIRILDVLLKAFANERLSDMAVKALKNLGPDGMKEMISKYVDSSVESRSAVCNLIGECGYGPGSRLIGSALGDPASSVRVAAVHAVGKLGLTDSIPGVVALLADSDSDVRTAAVGCLKSLALIDRASIQSVARQMGTSDKPEQRKNAATLFAALGDGDRLSHLAKDEDAMVRQAAVASIGKVHLTSADGILLIALADEDPDVRIAAAESLGEVGDDGVVTALRHALHDEDAWVQSAVLRSVARIAPGVLLDAIQEVFTSAEGLVKITCLELLDRLEGDPALQLIQQALDSTDSEVVKHAFSILSRRSNENVLCHAVKLLSHNSWDVRVACIRSIAQQLPAAQSREILSQALEGESNDVVRSQIMDFLKGLA